MIGGYVFKKLEKLKMRVIKTSSTWLSFIWQGKASDDSVSVSSVELHHNKTCCVAHAEKLV
jgi:hypothetical protein